MIERSVAALVGLVLLASAGCAQNQGLYYWGSYEDDLIFLYKHPGTEREFAEKLKTILDESRNEGIPPPPGIAAEYGFLNYQAGNKNAAIDYFDIERQSWPESAELMTTLIARITDEIAADALSSGDEPTNDGAPAEGGSGMDVPAEGAPESAGDGES